MLSGNYAEEVGLLYKLLQQPAFRFVVVRFNHYSVVRQLRDDLRARFPERVMHTLDAEKIDATEFQRSYDEMGSGILLLENFAGLLRDDQTSGENPAAPARAENERRHAITRQLNLRRDYLAKSPIALIVFVLADERELLLRSMMRKMPDLWSFRSLVLDVEVPLTANETMERPVEREVPQPLGTAELARIEDLVRILAENPAELDLRLTVYPQLVDLLERNGEFKRAIAYYEAWLNETRGRDRIDPLIGVGDTYWTIGLLAEAMECFTEAHAIALEINDTYATSRCLDRIASVESDRGNLARALELYEQDLELARKLVQENPEVANFKNGLAISYEKLGETHSSLGNLAKALEYFEERSRIGKELHGAYPDHVGFKNGLAISYEKLGSTHSSLGNLAKALEYFEQFNVFMKELHGAYPDHVGFKNGLAISYVKLGSTHSSLGNLAKALEYFEVETGLFEELHGAYPDNVGFKNGLAISYSKLGETHSSLGNLAKALEYFEQFNVLMKELHGAYPDNVGFKNGLAISYQFLGNSHRSLGDLSKALEYYEQYNQLQKELHAAYPDQVAFKNLLAISFTKLASAVNDKGKQKEYYLNAEQLWSELNGKFPDYKEFANNLAWVRDRLSEL